jgi:energy-converting hydrogenase Eha subunit G
MAVFPFAKGTLSTTESSLNQGIVYTGELSITGVLYGLLTDQVLLFIRVGMNAVIAIAHLTNPGIIDATIPTDTIEDAMFTITAVVICALTNYLITI